MYLNERKRRPKTAEQRLKEKKQKYEKYHSELKFDLEHKAKVTAATKRWQTKNPEKYAVGRCKHSALKAGVPFDLKPEDIIIPDVCPIMKVPFEPNTRYAATVDRIIPELGYVKGNIWIISKIANQMKSDSTPEERMKFSEYFLTRYV